MSERDPNFICAICEGDIVVKKTLANSRKIFGCANINCKNYNAEILECAICHMPRTIWADDGTICAACCLKWMDGKLLLTSEQIKGIRKWTVEVKIPLRP